MMLSFVGAEGQLPGKVRVILAIGSHSRKIGKTSILCAIIRGMPELRWSAVKISSNRTGASGGFECFEETASSRDRDTGRYLDAGASDAHWLRATDERMESAAAYVQALAGNDRHLIVESNRIVEHVRPDIYALALDFQIRDFKDSTRRLFARADAYLLVQSPATQPQWEDIPVERIRTGLVYEVAPPDYRPRGFISELREGLGLSVAREAVA